MTSEAPSKNNTRSLFVLYGIFTVSGFTGLIYESIWSHYLKLFLGHAAYAQTLVLAIFMGGMALGAWLSSKYSGKWNNLLYAYALIEFIIGIAAVVFHPLFESVLAASYDNIIPAIGSVTGVAMYKWSISSLLILPQSILLGMTFPIMSAGIIRRYPGLPGNKIAMLYFTNSIGAAVGVIISGFVLIRLAGLPGTIQIAGLINIILALLVWSLVKNNPPKKEEHFPSKNTTPAAPLFVIMGTISLLTGAASFIYEIGWIRMLSLVLGSSTHAFELMLSSFILGIALGGLWIKRKIDSYGNTLSLLATIQIVMGLMALSTLPLYGNTFELMQWILGITPKTDSGYVLFNLSSHFIAIIIMLPTAFFAGMTLPLITYSLINSGGGEKSIGVVYATNTIGAIIGIVFAIHIGLPVLGLKGLISLGAGIDIFLGISLFLWLSAQQKVPFPRFRTTFPVVALILTMLFVDLDAHKMASGVYRAGNILSADEFDIIYHKDGKTATVDLSKGKDGVIGIRTNGKVDASINMTPNGFHTADEATMVLAGALPLALNPGATRAANIGLGSGLTTHTLLLSDNIQQVDSIEIEAAMVEAAQIFRPKVELAYTSKKGKIHIDDAKTFFSNQKTRYDIIISEPSNPWVSGTASLFTNEFYKHVNNYLEQDGLLVQWIQLYEIDLNLVSSVLKSLSLNYSDYVIFACNESDILIIATKNGAMPELNNNIFHQQALSAELERINFKNIEDLRLRRIAGKKLLDPLLETFPAPPNSDYYPYLDQNAAKTRFMAKNALDLARLPDSPLPLGLLEGRTAVSNNLPVQENPYFPMSTKAANASKLLDYFISSETDKEDSIPRQLLMYLQMATPVIRECSTSQDMSFWLDTVFNNIALGLVPYLSADRVSPLWKIVGAESCNDIYTNSQKQWINLLKSVSQHNAEGVLYNSQLLLESQFYASAAQKKYLVGNYMIGSILAGNKQEAIAQWERFLMENPREKTGLVEKIILSHAQNQTSL